MPRQGYQSITLKDELVDRIDKLVDVDDKRRNSRHKVIELGVKRLRR